MFLRLFFGHPPLNSHSLALCSLGWDVLATDLPDVIDSVLAQNISSNLTSLPPESGTIQLRALDWTIPPEKWSWEDDTIIASSSIPTTLTSNADGRFPLLVAPFDLIITADTIYSPHLVVPLLRTLRHIYSISIRDDGHGKAHYPQVFVCIERRDPALVDGFLDEARRSFGVTRVQSRKMFEAMERKGLSWAKEDWEGMEIWEFKRARIATRPTIRDNMRMPV